VAKADGLEEQLGLEYQRITDELGQLNPDSAELEPELPFSAYLVNRIATPAYKEASSTSSATAARATTAAASPASTASATTTTATSTAASSGDLNTRCKGTSSFRVKDAESSEAYVETSSSPNKTWWLNSFLAATPSTEVLADPLLASANRPAPSTGAALLLRFRLDSRFPCDIGRTSRSPSCAAPETIPLAARRFRPRPAVASQI
jgi:hypothetical protein